MASTAALDLTMFGFALITDDGVLALVATVPTAGASLARWWLA